MALNTAENLVASVNFKQNFWLHIMVQQKINLVREKQKTEKNI